ncbi:MAG: pyridoxal phosphate-dependent aminotransferase family protein [Flavobacteriia bacterium]|nr:pyridoxal phosphate-dependent aminotransferase family protein [Flavobacteriia bacterium]
MDSKLKNKLKKRKEEGTLRSLSLFEGAIDFFSNDYLGLSRVKFESEYINQNGSTGSRLISGTSKIALATEQKLARFFEVESALIYNSGYDANVGFFSCIPQRGDTVLYDEYIHASVRDGIRMSFADSVSFKHNDLGDLERKIEKLSGTIYVSIESLYSMDGDIAPLKEIARICHKYKAYLVVDEAHASGVFGEHGKGLVDQEGIKEVVFARLVTFGKAYGSHGAAVLGSQELIDYQINFSRSFIYTTALPPESYNRIGKVIDYSQNETQRTRLQEIITCFRTIFKKFNFTSDIHSPIQLLEIGDVERTKELAFQLQAVNFGIKPIYSPTVPKGREGLRICLHSFNTIDDLNQLYMMLLSV